MQTKRREKMTGKIVSLNTRNVKLVKTAKQWFFSKSVFPFFSLASNLSFDCSLSWPDKNAEYVAVKVANDVSDTVS